MAVRCKPGISDSWLSQSITRGVRGFDLVVNETTELPGPQPILGPHDKSEHRFDTECAQDGGEVRVFKAAPSNFAVKSTTGMTFSYSMRVGPITANTPTRSSSMV